MKPFNMPPMLSEDKVDTRKPWYEKVQWLNTSTLVIVPFLAFIQIPFVPLHRNTLLWASLYYIMTTASITAGKLFKRTGI